MLQRSELSKQQLAVWDRIERQIQSFPATGICSDGSFSYDVQVRQKNYLNGLRSARLFAIKVMNNEESKGDG